MKRWPLRQRVKEPASHGRRKFTGEDHPGAWRHRRKKIEKGPIRIATVRGLGLRKIRQSVVREDNAQTRGLIKAVHHLVEVEEVS